MCTDARKSKKKTPVAQSRSPPFIETPPSNAAAAFLAALWAANAIAIVNAIPNKTHVSQYISPAATDAVTNSLWHGLSASLLWWSGTWLVSVINGLPAAVNTWKTLTLRLCQVSVGAVHRGAFIIKIRWYEGAWWYQLYCFVGEAYLIDGATVNDLEISMKYCFYFATNCNGKATAASCMLLWLRTTAQRQTNDRSAGQETLGLIWLRWAGETD